MTSTAPATPQRNRRSTRQKALIDQAMRAGETFVSAQAIHQQLRDRGESIGLATVYRNLQTLVADGVVDTLRNEDGEVLYCRCDPQHHHHLVCRDCLKVVEVGGPTIETWAQKTAADHGFTDVAHTVELFGLCASCSEKTPGVT